MPLVEIALATPSIQPFSFRLGNIPLPLVEQLRPLEPPLKYTYQPSLNSSALWSPNEPSNSHYVCDIQFAFPLNVRIPHSTRLPSTRHHRKNSTHYPINALPTGGTSLPLVDPGIWCTPCWLEMPGFSPAVAEVKDKFLSNEVSTSYMDFIIYFHPGRTRDAGIGRSSKCVGQQTGRYWTESVWGGA